MHKRISNEELLFKRDQYISVTFSNLMLNSRIGEGPVKLEGEPQRQLQKFFGDSKETQDVDLTGQHNGDWDQFEVIAKNHNVTPTFDETQYTTEIRENKLSKEEIEKIEEIAKSIEKAPSENFHVRADRGQTTNKELDEEKRYSAVIGTGAYKKGSQRKQKRDQKSNTSDKTPKVEFPTEVMAFTNSKKENIEMTHSIEAELGLTGKKSEAKSEVKIEEPVESATTIKKEPDPNAEKKIASQTSLSIGAKEYKPRPKLNSQDTKTKQGVLNTKARDFVPKSWTEKNEPKPPLKAEAKEFRPPRLQSKEQILLPIKPLEEAFILSFKRMCKQVHKKGIITTFKENWTMSSDITIRPVKEEVSTKNLADEYYDELGLSYPMFQHYYITSFYGPPYSIPSYPMMNPRTAQSGAMPPHSYKK